MNETRKVSGGTELRFWGECMKARMDGDGMFGHVWSLTELSSFEFSKQKRNPTDLPERWLRVLHVERCILSLALKGACGYYDVRRAQDVRQSDRAAFDAHFALAKQAIRGLCIQHYAQGRPLGRIKADRLYSGPSLLGMTRAGFAELLRYRLDDLKKEIESE